MRFIGQLSWLCGALVSIRLLAPAPMLAQGAVSLQAARGQVILRAPGSACRVAMLDEQPAQRGADSLFRFTGVAPGGYRLLCGSPLEIYVQPAAELRVTLSTSTYPIFQGRGAGLNRYLIAQKAMNMELLSALWRERPSVFSREWTDAYDEDLRQLRRTPGMDDAFRERESMRLRFKHTFGRVTYPYFHWRESDERKIVSAPDLTALLSGVPLDDLRWSSLPEHTELLGALIHENARVELASDTMLQRGDARWMRAEFAAALTLLADSTLLRRTTTRLLANAIEENGSRGIDSVYGRWLALGVDSASRRRIDSLVAVDRGMEQGHHTESYRTIDGVAQRVHILRPEGVDSTVVTPAMLWFHGGSWASGTWWHSPGVMGALRENGVTVVGVELRTSNRFDSGPLEQVEDAMLAHEWIVRHASRLRIDSTRVGVAGFSSGATLATILGTRGLLPLPPLPVGDNPPTPTPATVRRYPAAVIAVGACVLPGGPAEDGFFRKVVGAQAVVSEFTPLMSIMAGQPPTLFVHATNDEYCDMKSVRSFVEQSVSYGNRVALSEVENAGHFFGFYHPAGQRQMRRAIQDALRDWGWMGAR
ncbi:MAG TPA: alpha/beta hydrolase [Gemmatimonas aurantiaca]|nr:alpha/beta hydrolase [Gemmatimonas aurantiaca]HCT59230.1 alpha/beta hydrolase [Gemmatimonas aurantiaca]